MTDDFRILFVDDEETFLHATADLLRREGYACDAVSDVNVARQLLQQHPYDLVIADIKMPGNANLEFVSQLARVIDSVSIVLVTDHPSFASAVQSVELPVVAYLVKPFEFQELLTKVQAVVRHAKVHRAVHKELARLHEYRDELLHLEARLRQPPRVAPAQSLEALVGLTLRRIVDGLSNLHGAVDTTDRREETEGQLPPGATALPHDLREVLHDAVSTLERTKGAFRSKELGELRKKLEIFLKTQTSAGG